jgi:branched-chain amino acid transport system permease protein
MQNFSFFITSILKLIGVVCFIYILLWVLGHASKWVKIVGIIVIWGVMQIALSLPLPFNDNSPLLNNFDYGLLVQSCTIAMVSLGLNLIYGFNGQFSLGQYGFYGLGAYAAADIVWRWIYGDARGLLVVGLGTILGGLAILGIQKLLRRFRGVPVLSAFTLYLMGTIAAAAVAVFIGNLVNPAIVPLLKNADGSPGVLATGIPLQIIFVLAVIFAGLFAAEIAFLFGLPVLTLGSDYFGIATLGFTIVAYTLMVNSDTILPFPEMKGGRGMIGIPKLVTADTWFWPLLFLILVIIIMRNVIHSSTGRAILAVREDETAAKAMGIDVASNKLLTFVIGSFFAGLAGGVYAFFMGFLSPATFGFLTGFNPLIIVVFGGLGSMTGTLAAAFGWTFFLEGLLRNLLGQLGTEAPTWRFVLYPITLLLMMLIRPQGMLGTVEWGYLKAKLIAARAKKIHDPETPTLAEQ